MFSLPSHWPKGKHGFSRPENPPIILLSPLFSVCVQLASSLQRIAMYKPQDQTLHHLGALMSFSKLSLLAVAATLTLSGVSAHADSLNLGSAGGSFSFFFNGNFETAAGGNMTGSSAVIGGKTVDFSAVYCGELNDSINTNTIYNNTSFSNNGKVNGNTVHNDADIAWLLLNITATTTTQ